MNWTLLLSGLLLSGSLLISGCSMLPSPESLIAAPRLASAQTQNNDPLKTVVQEFLPPGAKLETPKNPVGVKAIQQQDMDGDGQAELLTTYRVGQNPGKLGAILLQKKQNNWEKVWEQNESLGYALDRVSFADLTGDGRPELLLGWTMGASAGNGLDVFTWQGNESLGGGGVAFDDDGNEMRHMQWQGVLTLMEEASIDYHRMDIISTSNQSTSFSFNQGDTCRVSLDKEGSGKQAALAVWHHDTEEAYAIEILRWTKVGADEGWAPADDLYPKYFEEVAGHYQEKVQENPKAGFYRYYLADAQVKAGQPESALKNIAEGEALQAGYSPENFRWLIVKGEALNKLGKYAEAKTNLFNSIRELERGKKDYLKNDCLIRAYFALGQSYEGLKETSRAKAAYAKSLELIKQTTGDGPRSLPVQHALEKLVKS